MSDETASYRRWPDGTPFALPDGMSSEHEHNNVVARLRALEAHVWNMDRRMHESHESWTHSVNKIAEGVRSTHDLLYHPSTGAFVRLDRMEQAVQAQSKFKAWLVGFATSGSLLVAGALLGKLLGK